MAGIYIHIPFCRQACHYCDFHFSTNLSRQAEMVDSICLELEQRRDYLQEGIGTIYFGGGTPSLLTEEQLKKIIRTVQENFQVEQNAEVTLEANPEDLIENKLKSIYDAGVNRLSIGVQTFSENRLHWMNRIHTAKEAYLAFQNSREAGFKNISLDLIYAIPEGGKTLWENDLKKLGEMQPDHISLYGLTIEDRTVFGSRKSNGEFIEVAEDEAAEQYLSSLAILQELGYDQYEVSNFCKPGFESRHNSSYWSGKSYLGVGPAAHSFDGQSRRFNVRNNSKYIKCLAKGEAYFEVEVLTKEQRMNETILTRLRTISGLDLQQFSSQFSVELSAERKEEIAQLKTQDLVQENSEFLSLTTRGILVADEIALQLFFDE